MLPRLGKWCAPLRLGPLFESPSCAGTPPTTRQTIGHVVQEENPGEVSRPHRTTAQSLGSYPWVSPHLLQMASASYRSVRAGTRLGASDSMSTPGSGITSSRQWTGFLYVRGAEIQPHNSRQAVGEGEERMFGICATPMRNVASGLN